MKTTTFNSALLCQGPLGSLKPYIREVIWKRKLHKLIMDAIIAIFTFAKATSLADYTRIESG